MGAGIVFLHSYAETSWENQVNKESLVERTVRATVHAKRTLMAGFTTVRSVHPTYIYFSVTTMIRTHLYDDLVFHFVETWAPKVPVTQISLCENAFQDPTP